MEILDIVDEKGQPTGETIDRDAAHRGGIRHRTSHVWLLRRKDGIVQVLLQKRSETKDSHPGCYDISSAGHIPAGSDYIQSAIRELKEELGIDVSAKKLIYCGDRDVSFDSIFFGKEYHDRQFSRIFVLWDDRDEAEYTIQVEELESVIWMDFDKVYSLVRDNGFRHCIYLEELDIIRKAF